MNSTKQVGQLWRTLPSGIVVPDGIFSDRFTNSRTTLLQIKEKAQAIESMYKDSGIRIATNSSLGTMLTNAKSLSDNWLLNRQEKSNYEMFFLGIHLDRIADAILPLCDISNKEQHLRGLLRGSLNFFERTRSKAKNLFWEVELWSKLRKRTKSVYLNEPPDIVVEYDAARIGIACKKLYTETHVQNVLSKAVDQIEGEFEFGIVGVNIDDLIPKDVVLKMPSSKAVSDSMNRFNSDFINRHVRHFTKYLSTGRIISALISCSIVADVETEKPRFRNTYKWTIWTLPSISAQQKRQIDHFYGTVMK